MTTRILEIVAGIFAAGAILTVMAKIQLTQPLAQFISKGYD